MSDLADTFEALCRAKNAVRKVRETDAFYKAANARQRGVIVIGGCAYCGSETHHDTWTEMDGFNVAREHTRCHKCGIERVY